MVACLNYKKPAILCKRLFALAVNLFLITIIYAGWLSSYLVYPRCLSAIVSLCHYPADCGMSSIISGLRKAILSNKLKRISIKQTKVA